MILCVCVSHPFDQHAKDRTMVHAALNAYLNKFYLNYLPRHFIATWRNFNFLHIVYLKPSFMDFAFDNSKLTHYIKINIMLKLSIYKLFAFLGNLVAFCLWSDNGVIQLNTTQMWKITMQGKKMPPETSIQVLKNMPVSMKCVVMLFSFTSCRSRMRG